MRRLGVATTIPLCIAYDRAAIPPLFAQLLLALLCCYGLDTCAQSDAGCALQVLPQG
jgi:hypothetical protein